MKQEEVGPALQRLREARGLSEAELAKRCEGLRTSQVKGAEKDCRSQLDTLGRHLEGLDANLCDLHRAMVDRSWRPPAPAENAERLPSLLSRPEPIGQAVQLLRRRARLTLQEVADELGMSKSGASDIESGSLLRMTTLERLLGVFDATLLDFHEALQVAHFLLAWEGKQHDETANAQIAMLGLGQHHLGSRDAAETAATLRKVRQRIPPSGS